MLVILGLFFLRISTKIVRVPHWTSTPTFLRWSTTPARWSFRLLFRTCSFWKSENENRKSNKIWHTRCHDLSSSGFWLCWGTEHGLQDVLLCRDNGTWLSEVAGNGIDLCSCNLDFRLKTIEFSSDYHKY